MESARQKHTLPMRDGAISRSAKHYNRLICMHINFVAVMVNTMILQLHTSFSSRLQKNFEGNLTRYKGLSLVTEIVRADLYLIHMVAICLAT